MPSTAQMSERIEEVPKLTTSRPAATTESTKPATAWELPGAGGCQAGACCGHCCGCGGWPGCGCHCWACGGGGCQPGGACGAHGCPGGGGCCWPPAAPAGKPALGGDHCCCGGGGGGWGAAGVPRSGSGPGGSGGRKPSWSSIRTPC